MIRTCPICSAFYADPGLAFCLADGAPLVGVDPSTAKWEEAKRYFERSEEVRKQLARKVKRRRLVVAAASALVIALVISVVTVNALILLEVLPNKVVTDQSPSPPVAVANPQPTPDVQEPTPGAGTPAPTPTPTATPTPTPTPTATPPTTPVVIGSPPTTPMPPAPPDTPPAPSCSAADREREKMAITGRYGEKWSSAAKAAPPKPPPGSVPGVETEVTLAGAEYSTTVLTSCIFASVNANFIWQVRQTYNGTTKISTFTTQKSYNCGKNGSIWICH